jgi:hypothetical protein
MRAAIRDGDDDGETTLRRFGFRGSDDALGKRQ